MLDPLSYFSFQPVLHDLSNKGGGMDHCGMMHIKEPLLLIEIAHVAAEGLLSRYPSTILYLTPYNRK